MRFSPSCSCCGDCDATEVDEFNRTTIGSDWAVDSGSWSVNGSQLVGSGEIYHNTIVDAAVKLTLNSGTVKVLLYTGFAPSTYDYVEIGSGSIEWYAADGLGGHWLIKSETGPSTGEFQICFNWGGGFEDTAQVSVTGPSYFSAAPGSGRYLQAGLGAASSVTVERFELLDYDDCCPACPACMRLDVPGTPWSGKLICDFGSSFVYNRNTWGPTEELTGLSTYCTFRSRTQGVDYWIVRLIPDTWASPPGHDAVIAHCTDMLDAEASAGIPRCDAFSITMTRQDPFGVGPATWTLKTP